MATKAWRGDEVRRSTTFLDLHAIMGCTTRLSILAVLSRGPVHGIDLCRALGLSQSLVSSHCRPLREAGMIEYDSDGTRHVYSLCAGVRITISESGFAVHLTGNDGSTLAGTIPWESPVMRLLQRAVQITNDHHLNQTGFPEIKPPPAEHVGKAKPDPARRHRRSA
jgi:DNA-binding transcriptional ArsR family regulator